MPSPHSVSCCAPHIPSVRTGTPIGLGDSPAMLVAPCLKGHNRGTDAPGSRRNVEGGRCAGNPPLPAPPLPLHYATALCTHHKCLRTQRQTITSCASQLRTQCQIHRELLLAPEKRYGGTCMGPALLKSVNPQSSSQLDVTANRLRPSLALAPKCVGLQYTMTECLGHCCKKPTSTEQTPTSTA